MSPTSLIDDFRKLKGTEVNLHMQSVVYSGTLTSWTSGVDGKVWITNKKYDVSVPIKQVRKVEAA